ncbi:hypothetical protein IFM89_014904 [Coptis chinensis]|uniref:Bifunctional inhibitor/plant lipid transfer protein/seed storage helical domain-containing protein n=1 Tax=Coptis chinensis TaxID=261450 RepID=A0A835H5C4_9MAGN|nr:hypothetical protein IFM89_014904 [Coptis chinensis]
MAVSKIGFAFIAIAIFVILASSNQVLAADCEADVPDLITQCTQYVAKAGPKVPPSSECCQVVKRVDIPCICSHIPSTIELIISMDKVVYVAGQCGRPVAHGFKCGSYTVPAPAPA